MSMASIVQNFPHEHARDQYSFEGYGGASNSAAFMASHFAFNTTPASACNDHKLNGAHADAMWAPNKTTPPMESPFTPSAPLILPSSLICTPAADPSSYMDAITRSCTPAEILAFNPNSAFDMDFPLSEENRLLELMGLQRKLSFYSSYGVDDDHDLSQGSIAAAADDEKESFPQACSYGGEVKLGNLARSLTFPPAGGARTESSCAARSPLILSSDAAGARSSENLEKHFNYKLVHRENSSAATTSCSNGDENELPKGKNARVKLEVSEVSQCMPGSCEQQGCIEQIGTTLNSRSYKQNKKRVANMSNSNTSAKVARVETPPDVVHVRARRGQATDSHSLAERVRREKISQRMKVLQEIVPGCHKVLGKAMMLDEIINYVKSLQKQVEFLSMKLAAANQASTIANEVKFLLPNMEFFGDFSSSCQAMKSEPLMISSIQ